MKWIAPIMVLFALWATYAAPLANAH